MAKRNMNNLGHELGLINNDSLHDAEYDLHFSSSLVKYFAIRGNCSLVFSPVEVTELFGEFYCNGCSKCSIFM